MLEKLKKVEEKFEFISAELCKSEVVSDMELYKKIYAGAQALITHS